MLVELRPGVILNLYKITRIKKVGNVISFWGISHKEEYENAVFSSPKEADEMYEEIERVMQPKKLWR